MLIFARRVTADPPAAMVATLGSVLADLRLATYVEGELRGHPATERLSVKPQGPAFPFYISYTRAREGAAGQAVARCYGVARPREGSRQNSIGGLGRALTPAFRAGSLYPLARGCRRESGAAARAAWI